MYNQCFCSPRKPIQSLSIYSKPQKLLCISPYRVSNKFGPDTVEERSHAAVHQLRESLSTNVHYINKFSASVQRR